MEYLEADNADPEPFVWSACVKAILSRAKRANEVLESLDEPPHYASPAGLLDFAAGLVPRLWRRAGFVALERRRVVLLSKLGAQAVGQTGGLEGR